MSITLSRSPGRTPSSSHGCQTGVSSGDNLMRVGLEEDGLNRRANTPDGSGGASRTVVTTRPDENLMADNDQDTETDDIMTPTVRSAHSPAVAAATGQDHAANGSSAAAENGTDGSAGSGL